MRRRFENILTQTGRLKKAFTPAVYFDTSVLVDYWSAEGLEVDTPSILPPNEYNEFLREFLKADKRISEVGAPGVIAGKCTVSVLASLYLPLYV